MKRGEKKIPDIYNDPFAVLSPEDKARLRGIITDPLYVKMLRIVERYKPSANCDKAGSLSRDEFSNERANARLGEIRGWELHIAACFTALTDTVIRREAPEPSFPNSGALDLTPRLPSK